jgi:hypothetical protein
MEHTFGNAVLCSSHKAFGTTARNRSPRSSVNLSMYEKTVRLLVSGVAPDFVAMFGKPALRISSNASSVVPVSKRKSAHKVSCLPTKSIFNFRNSQLSSKQKVTRPKHSPLAGPPSSRKYSPFFRSKLFLVIATVAAAASTLTVVAGDRQETSLR